MHWVKCIQRHNGKWYHFDGFKWIEYPCGGCRGNLGRWVDDPPPIPNDPFKPTPPKQGFFDGLWEIADKVVDSIPVLTWLHETGEAMFSLPEKYYTRLAGIGAVVGLIYGVYAGNLKMIPVTTLCGLIAGGGLLHIIGALLMLGALLLGLAIFLTLLAAFVGLILSGDETGRISQRRKIAHM